MKKLVLGLALAVAIIAPANAYNTMKRCGQLYAIRNNFFNERGLCFTKDSALELYPDNPQTCQYRRSADLPLSDNERRILREIVAEERALGCPVLP